MPFVVNYDDLKIAGNEKPTRKKNFERIKEFYGESVFGMKFIGQKKKINRHLRDRRGEHKMPCEDVFLRRTQ